MLASIHHQWKATAFHTVETQKEEEKVGEWRRGGGGGEKNREKIKTEKLYLLSLLLPEVER